MINKVTVVFEANAVSLVITKEDDCITLAASINKKLLIIKGEYKSEYRTKAMIPISAIRYVLYE